MEKHLKTSASDRKCMFPLCTHVLSIYNHETYCHIHRDQMALSLKTKISPHFNGRSQIGPR